MQLAGCGHVRDSSTVTLLSAGSIEPGLVAAVDAFNAQGAFRVAVTWSTAPVIRRRIDEGQVFDVVIAPRAAVDEVGRQHKVAAEKGCYVGRVGIGMVTRADVDVADISSAEALKTAVLDAQSVVYNRASSGLYVETLLRKMAIYDRIQEKTTRYDDGPSMMAHLIAGKGREIGFGAIIEILMFRERGLKLAAPLPAEVQHWTTYVAAPMTMAPNAEGARAFLRYLDTAPARALFAAHGID